MLFRSRRPSGLGADVHLLSRNARRLLVVTAAFHALGSSARVPSDQGHPDTTVPWGHLLPRTGVGGERGCGRTSGVTHLEGAPGKGGKHDQRAKRGPGPSLRVQGRTQTPGLSANVPTKEQNPATVTPGKAAVPAPLTHWLILFTDVSDQSIGAYSLHACLVPDTEQGPGQRVGGGGGAVLPRGTRSAGVNATESLEQLGSPGS